MYAYDYPVENGLNVLANVGNYDILTGIYMGQILNYIWSEVGDL